MNKNTPEWPDKVLHENWCPALGGIRKCACNSGDINFMREDCIKSFSEWQEKHDKELNGGYLGTHCHICLEAVDICRCVKSDSRTLAKEEK